MTKLVHSQTGAVLGEYPVQKGSLSIGRGSENDICLDDITVSGSHAVIEVTPSTYLDGVNDVYIIDQQSTNGTVINNKHVKRHLFKHGEVARIGQHDFKLIDEDSLGLEQTMVFIPEDD